VKQTNLAELYISVLNEMPLVEALWWFIENISVDGASDHQEIFFYLRERVRKEQTT